MIQFDEQFFNWVETQSVNQELRWFTPFEESFWIFKCKCQPPKKDGWKTLFLFGRPTFRGELLVLGRVVIKLFDELRWTSIAKPVDGQMNRLSVSFYSHDKPDLHFFHWTKNRQQIESVFRMFGFKKGLLFSWPQYCCKIQPFPKDRLNKNWVYCLFLDRPEKKKYPVTILEIDCIPLHLINSLACSGP